jgi:predicted membrane metal-binding protein
LRVLSLGNPDAEARPYRVRVTLPAKDIIDLKVGEAIALNATLQPPPEPIEPGGFDFGRQAWFARLGGTGYATSRIERVEDAEPPPWDLAAWGLIDALRAKVNARIRAVLPGETLFDPSFEMSFAAVVALVALYEWLSERGRERLGDVSPLWASLRKGWALISGAALTTLVAGTAIAPFAVYHFHRMTHYGLIANLIAAPLVSLLIMPMAVLSLLAMPFGLEAWPLRAMGLGIELMVGAGEWVASWPGAVTVLPRISGQALILIVLGGLVGLPVADANARAGPGHRRVRHRARPRKRAT